MRKRCENAELVPVTEKEFTVVSSYGQSVILGEGSKIIGDGIVMVKGFRIYAEYFFSFIIFSTFLTFFVNVK